MRRGPFGFTNLVQPEEVGVLLEVLVVDVGGDFLNKIILSVTKYFDFSL